MNSSTSGGISSGRHAVRRPSSSPSGLPSDAGFANACDFASFVSTALVVVFLRGESMESLGVAVPGGRRAAEEPLANSTSIDLAHRGSETRGGVFAACEREENTARAREAQDA